MIGNFGIMALVEMGTEDQVQGNEVESTEGSFEKFFFFK